MKSLITISLLSCLVACTSPNVEQSKPDFNGDRYQVDLTACRGGTAFKASATSIALAVAGSVFGAVHSIPSTFIWGTGWEGAAVGAALGAVVGFSAGAIDSYREYNQTIAQCVQSKGYTLVGD